MHGQLGHLKSEADSFESAVNLLLSTKFTKASRVEIENTYRSLSDKFAQLAVNLSLMTV